MISCSVSDMRGTAALAAALAAECEAGDCVLLEGDLGAGKTAFARGFIQSLQGEGTEVTSPTFTIAQHYPGDVPVWHFDLYRLQAFAELAETGLEEAIANGITLIEWPQIAAPLLPREALRVQIGFGDTPDARQLHFSGDAWKSRLAGIQKHCSEFFV